MMADIVAVQSYCFRNFKSNDDVARMVKDCGLAHIELCGVHVSFDDPSGWDAVLASYRKAGVTIVSIGVEGFSNNEARERKRFEFCRKAGVKTISADFAAEAVPQAYRTAEKLADEFDVRLAIHNHGGRHWLGSAQMLGTVFAQTSARIGLMLDTAWALDAGESPVALASRFKERLYGLHLKDFVFDRARKPEDVVIGEGNLPLAEMKKTLKEIGFNGVSILEYEGDADNPVPALTRCVEAWRKA